MVLPARAFDALLFGLLLIAAWLDGAVAATGGVATLLIVGAATYWAAQELSDLVVRRVGWSQEALATGVALCTGGFLYFLGRNSSDLALLALSLGLMMGALMVAISIMAAVHTAFKEGSATPIWGWIVTQIGALLLGGAAGATILALSAFGSELLIYKVVGIVGAWLVWIGRDRLVDVGDNPQVQPGAAVHAHRAALLPRSGTVLDRVVPLLFCGSLLFLALRGTLNEALNFGPPAVAAPGDAPDSGVESE